MRLSLFRSRTDPFSIFESMYPELVGVDSQGVMRSKVDLFQKEAQETVALTMAQEVSPGFWVSAPPSSLRSFRLRLTSHPRHSSAWQLA